MAQIRFVVAILPRIAKRSSLTPTTLFDGSPSTERTPYATSANSPGPTSVTTERDR